MPIYVCEQHPGSDYIVTKSNDAFCSTCFIEAAHKANVKALKESGIVEVVEFEFTAVKCSTEGKVYGKTNNNTD